MDMNAAVGIINTCPEPTLTLAVTVGGGKTEVALSVHGPTHSKILELYQSNEQFKKSLRVTISELDRFLTTLERSQ